MNYRVRKMSSAEDDRSDRESKQRAEKEREAFRRKMENTILMNSLKADGATIVENDDMPYKQMGQLYRAQYRLHTGSDDEYNTKLGIVVKKDADKRLQINSIAKEAIKFAPRTIASHWMEEMDKIDEPRGAMDPQGFADRLGPYVWKDGQTTTFSEEIRDSFTKYVKKVWDDMASAFSARATPLGDFMTWKTQLVPNTNSGDPLYESLSKEQWTNSYIPQLMGMARTVATGGELDREGLWTRGHYTLFGRTPNRPVHGVSAFQKLIGAKLNYDLTRGLGHGAYPHIAWMSLDQMLELTAEAMASVEATIHEDFKWFDAFVGPELVECVVQGLEESNFLKGQPENRNILMFLLKDMATSTWIRIAPHFLLKMKPGLYSGTPVTQIFGSVVHAAYLEMLRHERGVGITNYFVLSDDGMCTFEGTYDEAKAAVDKEMVPFAEEIGMKLNPEKSYVADITEKKVMFSGAEKIVRHDVGPFLQKYPQLDPEEAFGNIPRLIRSTKGRERDFERESNEMLFQYLPGLRLTEKSDRSRLAKWVPDFWRTLEVLAQVRPGYPRVRKMIRTYTKVYPDFWKRFDILVAAADATGGKLFDTATPRPGGASDKGTVRWLVDYLVTVRSTGEWPMIPEH